MTPATALFRAVHPAFHLGPLDVDDLTLPEALDAIATLVAAGEGGTVLTPNVDHVVLAQTDARLRDAYDAASLSLADGAPVVWASRLLGRPLRAKVSGSDLILPLMKLAAERGFRVFFLGGAPGVGERAAARLREIVPGLVIAGTAAPRIDVEHGPLDPEVVALVNAARPHLVLVALGCPKQEIFMHEAARAMRPAVLLGIGAGLDFWAGTARRAPPWVSRAGLEWLYRLVHEPRRLWRRYLVRDPAFLGVLAHDLQARSAAKRTPTAVPALRVALAGGSLAGALPEHLDLPGVLLDPRGDAAAPASHVLVIGGADDLARSGDDATFFVDRTRELVDSLQARSPRPEVILCSVPPAGADRTELNDEILAANRGLLSLVEERGLAWIDLHGMLRDDRAPAAAIDARFSRDGLHLRGPAYRLLRDALAAELGQPSPRLPADAARDAGALVRDAAVHRGVHSIDRALHRDLFARELDPERDRVALLFFGDVERDALVPGDRAARRLARQVRHALAHRQRHSGFTVAFQALCRALSRAGYRVVVNDAALARANPHHPIGIAGYPHILERWDLPNPAVLGPGLFDHPGLAPHLQGDPRFVSYLVPEGWMSDLFRRSWGDFCRPWHAGVDLSSWPSFRAAPKDIDALVYAKFLWGRAHGDRVLLAPLLASLERRGLRAHVLRYGAYEPGEYRALLRRSRAMIYLCEHETQGIACAEAMACDVPVLAWDQGRWLDPVRLRFGDADVPASSVPYFDARCGDRFAGPEDLDAALDRFFPSLDGYTPRAFVADRLSLDRSAQLYVAALREAASSPRR